ncbi:MAG: UDP-N-acetylmuramate dehydrogenase [Desulfobacterales bacterium]|jgi:UDP-N-acetylmuramate dehydrogenase|nr:UDP-N-acetylmuramate dehydrogenase [Desulfobacterales bacterium]
MTIPELVKDHLKTQFGERVRFDEPMSAHTTFKVGGPADAYVMAADKNELAALVRQLNKSNVPYLVMGKGSNLLVRDKGIRGVVISLTEGLKTIEQIERTPSAVLVRAMAGAKLAALCRYALQHNLSGMNFALGIPGSVGGAILMNAGASGGAMENVVAGIHILSPDGEIKSIERAALSWSYRGLSFTNDKGAEMDRFIILSGDCLLCPGDRRSLRDSARGIARKRWSAQPGRFPSAGCFFKNPEIGEPAGKLIEMSGLKGFRIGGAEVSEKHANFIINRGRASAGDILELSEKVRGIVYQKFGVKLAPEVKITGE